MLIWYVGTVSFEVPCPEGFPFPLREGCCKKRTKLADNDKLDLHLGCDGERWTPHDKRGQCCPGTDFVEVKVCKEGSRTCKQRRRDLNTFNFSQVKLKLFIHLRMLCFSWPVHRKSADCLQGRYRLDSKGLHTTFSKYKHELHRCPSWL